MIYNKEPTASLADALLRKACTFEGSLWIDVISVAELKEIIDTEEKTLDIVYNIRYNNSTK